MFYDFIYLAKGFQMRPKVRSTLSIYVRVTSRAILTYTFYQVNHLGPQLRLTHFTHIRF